MPNIPFRGLATRGIIKDVAPYQLPPDAFSDGSNVRFHGGMISRSPVYRVVVDALTITPVHGYGSRSPQGVDSVFIVGDNQVIKKWSGGAISDVTPTSYTPVATSRVVTTSSLGQVIYMNDAATVPYYLGPLATNFASLPGWDPTWRARSLRPFQNYLIALNVTKGAATFGNLVKWSNVAFNGLPPDSWDTTDTSRTAGENPLENLSTPLVDGVALRNAFVLYSSDEIWAMEPTSDALIFSFRALFHTGGMIAPDCGVEVNGKHYVMGPNDIYVHNGVAKDSIIDGKNRTYLFGQLNHTKANVCFAAYLPQYASIIFGYPTGPSESACPPGNGCNKGAVYDIPSGNWSFIDIPNAHSCTQASVTGALTYATCGTLTPATIGGSCWDQESTSDAHPLFVSEALSGALSFNRLLVYDGNQKGTLSQALCPEAVYPATISRMGLTLDAEGYELTDSKLIRRVVPQCRVYGTSPLIFKFGAANVPEGPYLFDPPILFDPRTQYKVDMLVSGRYLAFSVTSLTDDFDFSGFDADVLPNGRR